MEIICLGNYDKVFSVEVQLGYLVKLDFTLNDFFKYVICYFSYFISL